MKMRHKRINGGFTMVEMISVIALLGIVAALVFVNVVQYQRSLYQREMDEAAKEIYVAAQNHLTLADGLGTLSGRTDKGEPVSGKTNEYYFVVSEDRSKLSDPTSVLNAMLPPNSVDGSIRDNGSYVIHYKFDNAAGSSATVLGVYYANMSGRFHHTFRDTDVADGLFGPAYSADDANARAKRGHYPGGTGDAIIGYYGGDDRALDSSTLETPVLEIVNGEQLIARVKNPDTDTTVTYKFSITGKTSGASVVLPFTRSRSDVAPRKEEIVIDSITEDGAHFADLNELIAAGKTQFIPGENIEVQVYAAKGKALKKSAKKTTNSLFGSVDSLSIAELIKAIKGTTSTSADSGIAKINNIRHLENLSEAVSGYNSANWNNSADKPTSFQQTKDLSWTDFCNRSAGRTPGSDGTWTDEDNAAGAAIRIYPLTGDAADEGKFMPVNVNTVKGAGSDAYDDFIYEGNGRSITGVTVSASGNAGLFGELPAGSQVKNLELVDFTVTASGSADNAGALAGKATSSTISNVLVRGATASVTGVAAAGGLVGEMAGGEVNGCAAAVLVSASTNAGGLVGNASGGTITNSYSGGHTADGAYDSNTANVQGATAGGLVGLSGATITNCYTTCSVGGTTAGGLVGNNGASISNCYAVGETKGASSAGPVVGTGTGATSAYYLETVQVGDSAATDEWGAIESGASVLLDAELYDAHIGGGKAAAHPYDTTLTTTYGGKYSFKTIANMTDTLSGTLTKHLTEHYGDWPAVVTLVVNN